MARAMGFGALAMLTLIPLLIVVAAASAATHSGIANWVVYGMGLTKSSARAVAQVFSAPARVLDADQRVQCFAAGPVRGDVRGQRPDRVRTGLGPSRRAVAPDLAPGGMAGRLHGSSTRRPRWRR